MNGVSEIQLFPEIIVIKYFAWNGTYIKTLN